ncbi:RsfA family transcriptional regulator [Bacillus massiliglaciei]|uniref:RsfA family transcriptional regulator n=1 Tax=Bacillus massiliglaciei TaxID=1816693 RepID=UPI000B078F5D|nr:RsfA family transcriptional regulator [Bacillus massiliglaciei]
MSIARQDAWTHDEDILLAEVVLRHIREGSTQLKAFEEVGRNLSRTSAACGFRWNSYVRKQYKSGIEIAKRQRKEKQAVPAEKNEMDAGLQKNEDEVNGCVEGGCTKSLNLEEIITYLKALESAGEQNHRDAVQERQEYEELRDENERLREEVHMLQEQLRAIEDDYQALLHIMERARKLIVLEEDKANSRVKFQMEKNGNLERVNK